MGLEEIRGIHRAFGGTGTDDGVEFVDEEDHLAFAGSDFFEKGFEAIFELAAKFGAGNHRPDIHRDEALVFEGFGDIATDDPAGEAFHDRGLADARLADEDRVVFGTAGEDLHGAADLVIATDDRINLASTGSGGEVAAVFLEGLVFALGVLIGDALTAAHGDERLHQAITGDTALLEHFCGRAFGGYEREEEVLHAGEFVFQHRHLALGTIEDCAEFLGDLGLGCATDFSEFGYRIAEAGFERGNGDAEFFQERLGETIGLLEEREQEMLRCDLGVVVFRGRLEGGIQGLAELDGKFFGSHGR